MLTIRIYCHCCLYDWNVLHVITITH